MAVMDTGGMVGWGGLGWMTLGVVSNLNDSVILMIAFIQRVLRPEIMFPLVVLGLKDKRKLCY